MVPLKIDFRIHLRIIVWIHLRPTHATTGLAVTLRGSFIISGLEAKRLHLPQIMIIQVLLHTERRLTLTLVKENRSTRIYLLKGESSHYHTSGQARPSRVLDGSTWVTPTAILRWLIIQLQFPCALHFLSPLGQICANSLVEDCSHMGFRKLSQCSRSVFYKEVRSQVVLIHNESRILTRSPPLKQYTHHLQRTQWRWEKTVR